MNQERVFKVLLGPHVSEKATMLADSKSQFVFKVATDATKLEIKKAVESLFNVVGLFFQPFFNKGGNFWLIFNQ